MIKLKNVVKERIKDYIYYCKYKNYADKDNLVYWYEKINKIEKRNKK